MGVFAEVQQGAIFDKVGGQLPFAQGWAPSPLLSVEITFLCHGLNATSKLKLEGGKDNLRIQCKAGETISRLAEESSLYICFL